VFPPGEVGRVRFATVDLSVDVSDEASPDDRTMATRSAKSEDSQGEGFAEPWV
jgi:hypothetical protein